MRYTRKMMRKHAVRSEPKRAAEPKKYSASELKKNSKTDDRKGIGMELKGKTAIVTGGGRGIGEGIPLALAREGANVVVMDRGVEDANRVCANIVASGGKAIPFKADVTKKAEVQATVAAALKEFGTVDILVNNAGIEAPPTLVQDISEESWDRVIAVNLKGVFLCTQAVISTMLKQKKGRIINIGSIASVRMTLLGSVDYTASKHAVSGITKHLAWEPTGGDALPHPCQTCFPQAHCKVSVGLFLVNCCLQIGQGLVITYVITVRLASR